jgi:hypothetical protein
MRTSRVVFAGIAVAAAAATTSAFTASNTGMGSTTKDVAGYGENGVTGTHVSNVAYVPVGTDNTYLDYVLFTVTTNVSADTSTMTLKLANTPITTTPYSCTPSVAWDSTSMVLKCDVPDTTRIDSFDSVGLTVHQ